jgi:hypothetical protein
VPKDVEIQPAEDGAYHRHLVVRDPELLAPPES